MAELSAARIDAVSPSLAAKKPSTSLLPAFEPFSSSPALPRPLKRTRDDFEDRPSYPTPVPTSSTAFLTSSPNHGQSVRPAANAPSTVSERAPLSTVPSIQLGRDGKPVRLGRSSASCDFQLSSNRLISRVHVTVDFTSATSSLERDRIQISCVGWNGVKVHSRSKVYELKKGEKFTSDIREPEIMLDVHDSRVVLVWPEKIRLGPISSDEEDEGSPSKRQRPMLRHSTPPSPSPAHVRRRPVSPVSPSPAVQALLPSSPPIVHARSIEAVEIYEDPDAADDDQAQPAEPSQPTQATQILSQNLQSSFKTQATALSSVLEDFSDNDEENDPIIHSFGPFGANLLPRMAAFQTGDSPQHNASPKTSRSFHNEPLQTTLSPSQPLTTSGTFDVKSHIINQLAFSRLSSTPLSTILSHLPAEAGTLTKDDLRVIIEDTSCVGEVTREGKDAAGKRLESEFYYVPEYDGDKQRSEAVTNDLKKPGLRACRKQHKVSSMDMICTK